MTKREISELVQTYNSARERVGIDQITFKTLRRISRTLRV
jgi:hypothetical protein